MPWIVSLFPALLFPDDDMWNASAPLIMNAIYLIQNPLLLVEQLRSSN